MGKILICLLSPMLIPGTAGCRAEKEGGDEGKSDQKMEESKKKEEKKAEKEESGRKKSCLKKTWKR